MTGFGLDDGDLVVIIARWLGTAEVMERAHADISGASTGGLPPDVAAASNAFLSRWAELTQQSRQMAVDFATALDQVASNYLVGDQLAELRFRQLNGRLGGDA